MMSLAIHTVVALVLIAVMPSVHARDQFGRGFQTVIRPSLPLSRIGETRSAASLALYVESAQAHGNPIKPWVGTFDTTSPPLMRIGLGGDAHEPLTIGGRRVFPIYGDHTANLITGEKIAIGVIAAGAIVAVALIAANNQDDENSLCFFDSECRRE